jgi:hypothetical protein
VIERFNFYDLYGYLIPGVAIIIVALLPFPVLGLSLPEHTIPEGEVSALLLGVVVAYVIGHLIQSMAHSAFPSKFDGAYPSTALLDPGDSSLSPALKERIATKAADAFNIPLNVDAKADGDEGKRRQDVFFLARSSSNPKETGSYSEQHQGLYSMMRGLCVSFALGVFYTVGWILSPWGAPCDLGVILLGLTLLGCIALSLARLLKTARESEANRKAIDLWNLVAVALVAMTGGYLLGARFVTAGNERPLWILVAFYLAASARCLQQYRFFSREFALAIWRGFGARRDK